MSTLRAMASLLARVKAYLLVDEVYLECLFGNRPESCVHAGPNVVTTNSLTKAYGLDGLRAGWLLGPAPLIARAGRINDLMTNNSVAAGERMALAALRHQRDIDRRAHALLDPNLVRIREFFARETRLQGVRAGGRERRVSAAAARDGRRPARQTVDRAAFDARGAGTLLRGAAPHPDQLRLPPGASGARARQHFPRARCPRRIVNVVNCRGGDDV